MARVVRAGMLILWGAFVTALWFTATILYFYEPQYLPDPIDRRIFAPAAICTFATVLLMLGQIFYYWNEDCVVIEDID